METKTCPHCKSEMPKAATTCPACGKEEMTWGILLVALFFVLPFVCALIVLLS